MVTSPAFVNSSAVVKLSWRQNFWGIPLVSLVPHQFLLPVKQDLFISAMYVSINTMYINKPTTYTPITNSVHYAVNCVYMYIVEAFGFFFLIWKVHCYNMHKTGYH